jgi:hypothetical protein
MRRVFLMTVVLAAAGLAACGGDRGAGKTDAPGGAPAPTAAAAGSSQLANLLPAKDEVRNWAVSKAARTFTADNLWELIDGAADGFVTYGVQQVVTADYTQAGTGYQAVIEIYQMKDPLNAYGKYSDERNPEYQFLNVGNEGYSGGTSVNFWKGQFYVKITTFEEKDAIKQETAKLAQAVAAKIPAGGAEPREVAYFPKENQLPHTTRYIPKDVLAQSYLTNGFESRYKGAEKKESKLVFMALESDAAAQDALTRYRQFVAKSGKDVRDIKAPGEGGFIGKDSFYGNVAAVRAGKNLVVALGAVTEEAGRKQLAEIVGNVK